MGAQAMKVQAGAAAMILRECKERLAVADDQLRIAQIARDEAKAAWEEAVRRYHDFKRGAQ